MPYDLDLTAGYTLRVTAIDPNSGSLVSGVVVDQTVITADATTVQDPSELAGGDWFLVPGPGA